MKANHVEIFIMLCCYVVIGFFEVEKDSDDVLLFKEGIPYEGLHAIQMVEGAEALSEATLEVGQVMSWLQ